MTEALCLWGDLSELLVTKSTEVKTQTLVHQ